MKRYTRFFISFIILVILSLSFSFSSLASNELSDYLRKQFGKNYTEAMNIFSEYLQNPENTVSVEATKKGLKETLDYSRYQYYGDQKNGKPNGWGVFIHDEYIDICKFKNGSFSNSFVVSIYAQSLITAATKCTLKTSGLFVTEPTVVMGGKAICYDSDCITFEGNMKNGNYDGKGVSYYYSNDPYAIKGNILYEGSYKNSDYDGKGKLYYPDGTLKYNGKFKKGKYHGSGKLYNEDGTLKYKGKFKNGDIQ